MGVDVSVGVGAGRCSWLILPRIPPTRLHATPHVPAPPPALLPAHARCAAPPPSPRPRSPTPTTSSSGPRPRRSGQRTRRPAPRAAAAARRRRGCGQRRSTRWGTLIAGGWSAWGLLRGAPPPGTRCCCPAPGRRKGPRVPQTGDARPRPPPAPPPPRPRRASRTSCPRTSQSGCPSSHPRTSRSRCTTLWTRWGARTLMACKA